MAESSKDPPVQDTSASNPQRKNDAYEMTEDELRRLTEERDAASGAEFARLEGEVRAAKGKLAFQTEKKERQKREAQRQLDGTVAPKPFDGAMYSVTGRRAEGDQKMEFEGWSVLSSHGDEKEKK